MSLNPLIVPFWNRLINFKGSSAHSIDDLMNYWGPLANHRSSDWIVDAIIAVMAKPEFAPELLLTYIPHLDYDLQRYGPGSEKVTPSTRDPPSCLNSPP